MMAPTTPRRVPRSKLTAEQWNAKYPPGTPVRYTNGLGVSRMTATRSKAWNLGHGEPVVMIDGASGGYALWCLEPQ